MIVNKIKPQARKIINDVNPNYCYMQQKHIWMMWWQGEDAFPSIISSCIDSVKHNAKGWDIHIITKDTYKQYLDIPPYIEERVNNKQMSLTHLCDYLRFKVLNTHGGLWLDSSVFVTRQIDIPTLDKYWTYRQTERKIPCISHCRWSGIVCYMPKGHFFSEYMVRFYDQYWLKCSVIIDYFLVDYLTYIAYTCWEPFIQQISNIPYDNPDMLCMLPELDRAYKVEDIEEIKKLPFIKLKYKNGYAKMDENGNTTLCEAFANGTILNELKKWEKKLQ